TDVWMVHAGYAERRKALLRAGVRLFEMRGPDRAERPRRKLIGAGSGGSGSGAGSGPGGSGATGHVLRSSATTLHAKTFAADRRRLFVGSFNFDPRSMHLNTELGFVIDSPPLAEGISDAFEDLIPRAAYEVVLDDDGQLNWIERRADSEIVHKQE